MHDMRALVVDDSKVGRLTMMKKLEAMGLTVELAESGQQALDHIARQRPDMIFMDHMMPEMDGFEVTRRIKASPATREIPVIIISGNDEATFVEEARAAGAIDAIAKPPATEVLEALLAALPKRLAEAAAPQPTVLPAASPALDMAEAQALLERLLGQAIPQMRNALMAEFEQRLETQSATQHNTQTQWAAQLEQQAAAIAEFGRHATQSETLEQRLLVLEVEAGKPQPDFHALQTDIDQRIDSGLAKIQARADGLTSQLDSLHQSLHEVQAGLNARTTQIEQKSGKWEHRLDMFGDELARVSQAVQSLHTAQTDLEQHIARMQEASSEPRQVTVPVRDDALSGELRTIQAELVKLRGQQSDARLQALVAGMLNTRLPNRETAAVVEAPATPQPPVDNAIQAEVGQLKGKLKTLTIMTAIGGALLVAVIGMTLFGS